MFAAKKAGELRRRVFGGLFPYHHALLVPYDGARGQYVRPRRRVSGRGRLHADIREAQLGDDRPVRGELALNVGIAHGVLGLCEAEHAGQRQAVILRPALYLTAGPEAAAGALDGEAVRQHGHIQLLGEGGGHAARFAVYALLAQEDGVYTALGLRYMPERRGNHPGRREEVRARGRAVAYVVRLVRRDGEPVLEHGFCLLGARGHDDYIYRGVGVLQPGRGFQRVPVEVVHGLGHPVALESRTAPVEPQPLLLGVRHLLYTNGNVHWQPPFSSRRG